MARTVGSSGLKTMEAIHKAGLRLIFRHGYEAMTLRQLAAAIGVQQGSLYNHIKTKQDLLFGLIKRHMDDLLAALDRELKDHTDPTESLIAFIKFHVHYHATRQHEVFISYSELRSLDKRSYRLIVAMRDSYERRLIDILDAGVKQGAFRKTDTHVAAFGMLAMLSGICTWYKPGGRLGQDEIANIYLDLILKGIR